MFNFSKKTLMKILGNSAKLLTLSWLVMFISASLVEAKVCLLPGGQCPGDPGTGIDSDPCEGYNLTQVKCFGEACEEGWDCDECTNASGTHYKCTKKATPAGYTPGLEECTTPCQAYTWSGFTGTQINGKCTPIPYADATPTDPGNPGGECYSYIMPDYVYKINILGANVAEVSRHNCYANIVKLDAYTTTKPASCTTYNSRYDGLGGTIEEHPDTMCYTAGVSIGTYFSTDTRDDDVFIVETKYGTDNGVNTEPCYRATGCNASNGWLAADQVDANKFNYLERTSDGVACRKAIACMESNNWYDYDTLGKYKDIYFTMETETKSGLTCYRATGCHGKAYDAEPDTTYFTIDKKTSNGKNCWTVTGKAAYAYDSEELPKHFAYSHKTANLNGTNDTVTYYRIESCMNYAYASQPDARFFTFNSQTRKKQGTNTDITCWNVTGKANYAYNAGDRKLKFFDYLSAAAYLNGTSTQGTYYIVNSGNGRNGCMQYAYESQPNSKYFTSTSETQYSNGSSTQKVCWNATGKSPYAYTAGEKQASYFAYDSGLSAYLNGESSQGTYYNITGCGGAAVLNSGKSNAYLTYDTGKSGYFGGVNNSQTCYLANGCNTSVGALATTSKNTTAFNYDSGATQNGYACVKATGCNSGTGSTNVKPGACKTYSTATHTGITCYYSISTTGNSDCTTGKPGACRTYSSGKDTNGNTVYYSISVTGASDCTTTKPSCRTWTNGKDTNGNAVYYNISGAFGNSCVIAGNRVNCYTYTSKNDTAGTTWYYNPQIVGASANTTKPTGCKTWSSGAGSNGTVCYWGVSGVFANDCTTGKPAACKTYSSKKNTDGTLYYYSISTTGASDCTTTKPSCRTWKQGKDTNGNVVYYSISGVFGSSCVVAASRSNCYNYSAKQDTAGTWWYYNPTIMATGATTTKPSVTASACNTFSYAAPSTNGNGTKCYYNISNVTSSKPAASQTVSNGDYAACTCTSKTSGSCTCSCTCSCTSSVSCGCGGSRTDSGTKSGSKSGTRTCTQTASGRNYRDVNQTRTVTCDANGAGWSTGSWTTSSYGGYKGCGSCGTYSGCSYSACSCSSSCSCSGNCNITKTGSCSQSGCSSSYPYCKNYTQTPGNSSKQTGYNDSDEGYYHHSGYLCCKYNATLWHTSSKYTGCAECTTNSHCSSGKRCSSNECVK